MAKHDDRTEIDAHKRCSEMVASALCLERVLHACLALNLELSQATGGAIYLTDPRTGDYHLMKSRALPLPLARESYPAGSFQKRLDGQMHFTATSQMNLDRAARRSSEQAGLTGLLLLPMRCAGTIVGVAMLMFPTTEALPDSTIQTLLAIAESQAAAISNARVKDELERRAALAIVLHSFAMSALNAATEAELFELGLATALELSGGDGALLTVRNHVAATRGEGLPAIDALLTQRELDDTWMSFAFTKDDATVGFIAARRRAQELHAASRMEAFETMGAMMSQAHARITTQQAAARRSLRLDLILEQLPMSIVVIKRTGEISHSNAFTRTMLEEHHVTADLCWREILETLEISRSDGKYIPPQFNPATLAFEGVATPPTEFSIVYPPGTKRRWVLVGAAPLIRRPLEGGGDIVEECLVVVQDISAVRELMEEKERFLSIASHELRSPITTLRATASLIKLDSASLLDAAHREDIVARLDRQTSRLSTLVTQLLECARLGNDQLPLCLQQGNLVSLCNDAISAVSEVAGPSQKCPKIEFEHGPELTGVWDLDRLEQVLVNLLSNAVRYSDFDAGVRLRVEAAGEMVVISVVDHGVGIAPEHQKQLFSPFFRSPEAREKNKLGVGLGLYVSAAIVRRHGGSIEVQSAPHEGATFTVKLPRNTIDRAQTRPVA